LQRNEEENALTNAWIKEVALAGSLKVTNETFNPALCFMSFSSAWYSVSPCQISTSKGNKNNRRVMSCGIMQYIPEKRL
jgi:hypothetical protein